MWKRDSASELRAEIDEDNSWTTNSLVPAGMHELSLEKIEPRSLPIRLPKLKVSSTGFLFPEANQWKPPAPEASQRKKTTRKKRFTTLERHRIKPPNDVVKLQDRLYYLLQPPLDLLVGSGQLNFPFDPFPLSAGWHRISVPHGMRLSWPMRWVWEKQCKRSARFACCFAAESCAASCWSAPNR